MHAMEVMLVKNISYIIAGSAQRELDFFFADKSSLKV